MGERLRGGVREGESEHQPGVQGAADPGQAQVQSEPGVAASPPTVAATPAAHEFAQQRHPRALTGAAAASAADSRAVRVQEELVHLVVRRPAWPWTIRSIGAIDFDESQPSVIDRG